MERGVIMTVVIHGTQGIDTPDLDITGSGARINADFSSVPHVNRVSFQTSIVDGTTTVQAVPNGTALNSSFVAFNQSTPVNCAFAQMTINEAVCTLASGTIGSGTSLPMTFNAGGAERIRIATNGDVGIGVDPSLGPIFGKLQVGGSIVARATGGGEGGEIAVLNPDNASVGMQIDVSGTPGNGRIFSSNNNFSLEIGQFGGTGGTIGLYTQNARRIHINAVGRVGIGNVDPGTTLDVSGGILARFGTPGSGAANNNGYAFRGDGDTGMYSQGDGNLEFWNNNVKRLEVRGGASSTLLVLKDHPSDFGNCHLECRSDGGDVKISMHAGGQTAVILKHLRGQDGLLIVNSGDNAFAPIAASAFNINSDHRLKENIVPMQGALARAMQLRPCIFTWKADGSYGEGFIAHQLQEVVPIAVTGKKDAMLESGEPDYQGVDAAKIVALLTAALQELKHEVDSLRAEVKLLKGAR